ncbi:FAD-binding oxidoreductase [Pseudaminobacter arsenicus]|uniref:D-lactate dehydrogenase (cytochrome) n=2 Tax=Borborobacter arsenicus TaxID=1851146 RepID=A0A432V859_9HYPH|nr:FAD-binding oxidoreductase [Pseudaminobacter arsenicus]
MTEYVRADDFLAVEMLRQALGDDRVLADQSTRDYYANDIFWQPGIPPLAVIVPKSVAEVVEAVKMAVTEGLSIVPRGGGMSCTKGYLPDRADSVVIDACGLDDIIELNADDLYATVGAGCTWDRLNAALEPTGLRAGCWGPLSGANATVGGALSQNSAFFGSALNGTVAETVLGVTVVLASGDKITTGSGGRKGARPFSRHGGPDFTGMFLGDNGAFGIKVAATLRLGPRPPATGCLSFGFNSMLDMVLAQTDMARTRLVSEGFGIDRNKAGHDMLRICDGLPVAASAGEAATGTAGGMPVLTAHNYMLHIVTEADTQEELCRKMDVLREIGSRNGVEIENTLPEAMRSKPFSPVWGMLGSNGERWVPIHALFPLSAARKVTEANEAFFAERKWFMGEHGIQYSVMSMTVGNEFFLEPAFYWHDEITPLHARSVGEDMVRPWMGRPANPESRKAVAELRRGAQQLYAGLGGVNWQIARDYPYAELLDPETWAFAQAIKRALDPAGLMNPGSLGFGLTRSSPIVWSNSSKSA